MILLFSINKPDPEVINSAYIGTNHVIKLPRPGILTNYNLECSYLTKKPKTILDVSIHLHREKINFWLVESTLELVLGDVIFLSLDILRNKIELRLTPTSIT
jgi:hypothetical protein